MMAIREMVGGNAALAAEDERVQVPPPTHTESFVLWKEVEYCCCPVVLCQAFFFTSPYLCLVVGCVRRRISTLPLSVSLVFQEKFFAFILFCTTTRPCLLSSYMKITFFLKNHLFFFRICMSIFKKKKMKMRK